MERVSPSLKMQRTFSCYFFSLLLLVVTLGAVASSLAIIIKANELAQQECSCQNGTNGLPGMNDSCVCCPYSVHAQDIQTVWGSAQYVNTAQTPGNNNRGNGDAFRLRSPATYNDKPLEIMDFINAGGTIFNLTEGTYEFVYGTALTSTGSICLYNGSSVGSMTPLLESMVGANVANMWLHGNYVVQCNSLPCYIKLAPYNSTTLSVATAPSLSSSTGSMLQISILKLY